MMWGTARLLGLPAIKSMFFPVLMNARRASSLASLRRGKPVSRHIILHPQLGDLFLQFGNVNMLHGCDSVLSIKIVSFLNSARILSLARAPAIHRAASLGR